MTESGDLYSTVRREEKDGFEPVESEEEAQEVLSALEHGEKMLKYVTQGDGLGAGTGDVIRPYPNRDDSMQVEITVIGRVLWPTIDEIAADIYEKQLPVKVVEWEDRF